MISQWLGESLRGPCAAKSHTRLRKSAKFPLKASHIARKVTHFRRQFCGPPCWRIHPHGISRYHFVITYFGPFLTFIP